MAGTKVAEDVVFSLDFQNAPLRRVSEKITQVAGCKILIDQKFKNIPVSASVKGVSLNEGRMRNVDKYCYIHG